MASATTETILFIKIPLPRRFAKIVSRAKRQTGIASFKEYRFSPHITLHLCRIPHKNWRLLVSRIQNMQIPSFAVAISNVQVVTAAARQYFYLMVKKNNQLRSLQYQLLKEVNRYRNNQIRSVDKKRMSAGIYSVLEKRMIRLYGYPLSSRLFHPHVTVGPIGNNWRDQLRTLKVCLRQIHGQSFLVDSYSVVLRKFDIKRQKYTDAILHQKVFLKKL